MKLIVRLGHPYFNDKQFKSIPIGLGLNNEQLGLSLAMFNL